MMVVGASSGADAVSSSFTLYQSVELKYFRFYRTQQGCVRGRRSYGYHHGRITVPVADEKTAPERTETGGVEGGETRARGAAAVCVRDAQARTRA